MRGPSGTKSSEKNAGKRFYGIAQHARPSMADEVIVAVVLLLVALGIATYLETRFLRKKMKNRRVRTAKRDDEMQDHAHNAIITTKAITSSLDRRGRGRARSCQWARRGPGDGTLGSREDPVRCERLRRRPFDRTTVETRGRGRACRGVDPCSRAGGNVTARWPSLSLVRCFAGGGRHVLSQVRQTPRHGGVRFVRRESSIRRRVLSEVWHARSSMSLVRVADKP